METFIEANITLLSKKSIPAEIEITRGSDDGKAYINGARNAEFNEEVPIPVWWTGIEWVEVNKDKSKG